MKRKTGVAKTGGRKRKAREVWLHTYRGKQDWFVCSYQRLPERCYENIYTSPTGTAKHVLFREVLPALVAAERRK